MYKPALVAATISGILAVIIGAFGAHGLKNMVEPHQLPVWEKGVQFQFYHTFALMVVGMLYALHPFQSLRVATVLFLLGILFFSGSLYAMVGLSVRKISIGPAGIITPIGGICFIGGWICLLLAILRKH